MSLLKKIFSKIWKPIVYVGWLTPSIKNPTKVLASWDTPRLVIK